MQRRKFLLASGLATTTLLAGCSGSEGDGGDNNGDDDGANGNDGTEDNGDSEGGEAPDEALEDEDTESTVEGLELVEDDFSVSVEGVVTNNTGEEPGYVEVGAVFYNDEEQRIGDSFTNTTDLSDGEE